jgi:hypothetical protein
VASGEPADDVHFEAEERHTVVDEEVERHTAVVVADARTVSVEVVADVHTAAVVAGNVPGEGIGLEMVDSDLEVEAVDNRILHVEEEDSAPAEAAGIVHAAEGDTEGTVVHHSLAVGEVL